MNKTQIVLHASEDDLVRGPSKLPPLRIRVTEDDLVRGPREVVPLSAPLHYMTVICSDLNVRSFRRGAEMYFHMSAIDEANDHGWYRFKAREITDTFLAIRTSQDAEHFLSRYGPWGRVPWHPEEAYDRYAPNSVKWSDMLALQAYIRKGWEMKPWQLGKEFGFRLSLELDLAFSSKGPSLFASSETVVETLLADLMLTTLAGLQTGFCARADCNKLFEKTSNHERKYCSPECAHIESVRKHRARASKSR